MPFRTACLLTIAAGCLLPTPAMAADDQCPGATDEPTSATAVQAARTVTCLVDAERDKHGLQPLRRDEDLDLAARRHGRDRVRNDAFSHTGTDGSDIAERMRAAGHQLSGTWTAGEALGWGTGSLSTPAALVLEWLASPPHRRILLGREFHQLGVGVVAGAPEPTDGELTAATYTLDFAS
jgi:uncharacterized protein YkwD